MRVLFACAPILGLLLQACGGGTTSPQTPDQAAAQRAPVAVDDRFTADTGSENNSLDVLANDRDADGDAISLTSFNATTSAGGSLTRDNNGTANNLADDRISYTPNPSFQGEDTFSYVISDSNNGGDTATVIITVSNATPPPDRSIGCGDQDARLAEGLGYCFDATFNTSHDNTLIDMTVFVPHPDNLAALTTGTLAENELGFVPLVIHSHGFGGSKNTDFELGTEHFVDNQTGLDLWSAGYFVISFSERGFGQSGGQIGFMDATVEGQDQNELLDWAIKHLRGPSTIGGDDGIYDFVFTEMNPEHISSEPTATADTRPSLIMNDQQSRLQPNGTGDAADPSVGTLGYSYGGGYQYTLSHADTDDITERVELERIDALIPEGTWHDLRYSLSSNDVPKGYWATLLFGFAVEGGTLSNGQPVPQFLVDVYREAIVNGRVSSANQNFLGGNGTSFYCNEANGSTTSAALLHIQGVRDTLFDFNDGYSNVKCFNNAGNDSRYLAVSGGHPLTITQQPIYTGQTTAMDIDEVIHCGIDDATGLPKRLIVKDLMYAWFEEKLRGQTGAADIIPTVCINQENTDPSDLLVDEDYHGSNASFNYLKEGVVLNDIDDIKIGALSPNEVVAVANTAYACDTLTDGEDDATCSFEALVPLASLPAAEAPTGAQVFVPLYTESTDGTGRVMAGIPTAKMQLEIGASLAGQFQASPVQSVDTPFHVFVGIGLQRGEADPVILHDQLTPIRRTFEFPFSASNPTLSIDTEVVQTENGNPINYGCGYDAESLCERGWLVGVTSRILPGDQIGLIFTPSDVQYPQLVNNAAATLRITGDVQLPIYPESDLPGSNNP